MGYNVLSGNVLLPANSADGQVSSSAFVEMAKLLEHVQDYI